MKTTPSKRERGWATPSQRSRLAEQREAARVNRGWHERRAAEAEKRAAKARETKKKAGPQGGRLRALALLAKRFASGPVVTPVTVAAVQQVERDARGRMVPHRNVAKDRTLRGKGPDPRSEGGTPMTAAVVAPQAMRTMLKNARGMWLILEAAEQRGLPMPFSISAYDIDDEAPTFQFHTADEVITWAEVLETDLTDYMRFEAKGEWLEVPIRVVGPLRAEVAS